MAVAMLAAAAPAPTGAQAAPAFDVVSVSHHPSGRLAAAVQVSDPRLLAQGNVTVTVDGAQRPIRIMTPQDRAPIPVVLVIDTSSSMAGAPMAAASDALRQLVAGLAPRDPVAVLGFSDKAEVYAPFGVDRAATHAAMQTISAAGGTALHQAVEAASGLAAGASRNGMVVLVSGGADTAGASLGRATSLQSVMTRGARVYVFGLGGATDAAYLQSLAELSGGRYEAVASADALRRPLAELGRTLGTATSIEVAVPPLTKGDHSLRFRIGDTTPIERAVPFQVSNAGMLTATPSIPADPAAPIVIAVTAPVPLATLPLRMRVQGRDVPLSGAGEALLDPWTLAPGSSNVELFAATEAGVIAQTQLQVAVPELKPMLSIKRDVTPTGERLLINAHAQTPAAQSIVVRGEDGRELLRSRDALAEVALGPSGKVTVELLAGERVVLTESVQVGGLFDGVNFRLVGGMLGALAVAMVFVLRRRRTPEPSAAVARALRPAVAQPTGRTLPLAAASQAAEQMTNIVVRTPEGQTRRIVVRRGAALTIGTDSTCDIRLADDAVRGRHGLLTRMEDGHFELHPLGPSADVEAVAARVLLRPGDPVRIGQHVLVIE